METIDVGYCELGFGVASFLIFVGAIYLASQKRWKHVGPHRGKSYNWTTFAVGVFLACFVFSIPYATRQTWMWLYAFFYALQMLTAGHDAALVVSTELPDLCLALYVVYASLLYAAAPVSMLVAIVEYASLFLSPIVAWHRSLWHDTYAFSCLNERTVTLAESVNKRFPKASLVFADVGKGTDEELRDRAHQVGAVCLERPIGSLWKLLSLRHKLFLLLDSDDDLYDITYASTIRKKIECGVSAQAAERIKIIAVASFSGAAALLGLGENVGEKGIALRRIDWVRSLVERTADAYPLFLDCVPPACPDDASDKNARERYAAWQERLYKDSNRHILVVGGGHVGTEFLRYALSTCVFAAPKGEDTMSFRFDVFDSTRDPRDPDKPLVQSRLEAEVPDLLDNAACEFHVCDALTSQYYEFLSEHVDTISYVFVALGKDPVTTQVAMRTREVLERALVERVLAGTLELDAAPAQRRDAYESARRALVVATVDSDEIAEALETATEDGFAYSINTVGSAQRMYTYDSIYAVGKKKTEYKDRSSRASSLHGKYKLFAFARSGLRSARAVRNELVDWCVGLDERSGAGKRTDGMHKIVAAYDRYLEETLPLPESAGESSESNHEWLLRMEHDRWNAFMWADGFTCAEPDVARAIYDVGQPEELHRHNLARLHPCLVDFYKLSEVDEVVDALNEQSKGLEKEKPFQLNDDAYVAIGNIRMKMEYEFHVDPVQKERLLAAVADLRSRDVPWVYTTSDVQAPSDCVIVELEAKKSDLGAALDKLRQRTYGSDERVGRRVRLLGRRSL